jgi:hypothetical protein
VSVTLYVLCGAGSCILFSPYIFSYTLPIISIYNLSCRPWERRTALSVNAAPYERRRPASGARLPDKVLCRGPGLSLPGVHLEESRDTLRSLPDSAHRPGLQVAPARRWGLASWARIIGARDPPRGTPGCPEVSPGLYALPGIFPMHRSGLSALLSTLVQCDGT